VGRSENSGGHEPCLVDTLGDVGLVEGELVGGELEGRKVSFESLMRDRQRRRRREMRNVGWTTPTAKREVEGKAYSTSLVRAENVHTGQRFDSGQLLHDGFLLGKEGGADGHSGGGDDGETDGNTDDEENESAGRAKLETVGREEAKRRGELRAEKKEKTHA
jgi:hypothetical protein